MGGHQVMWVEPRDGVRHPTELPPPPAAGDGQWGTQSVHQEETPRPRTHRPQAGRGPAWACTASALCLSPPPRPTKHRLGEAEAKPTEPLLCPV